jgi:hypothetical protein
MVAAKGKKDEVRLTFQIELFEPTNRITSCNMHTG